MSFKYLFKPIKIKASEDNTFFWCCPHYGHDPKWEVPLWKMRGHDSSAQHDASIFDALKNLPADCTLFLLGDNAFGQGAEARLERLLTEANFATCFMMPGNHTAGWSQLFEKKADESSTWHITDTKKVVFVPNYLEVFLNHYSIVLSHYPILSWNGVGSNAKGSGNYKNFHFFGHVHNSLEKSEIGRMYLENGICEEVSVERYAKPASFRELKDKLNQKVYKSVDHHGAETQNPF
jgi:calcineurin-like phosphoesterase family protein